MNNTNKLSKKQGHFVNFLNFSKDSTLSSKVFVLFAMVLICCLFLGMSWFLSKNIETGFMAAILVKPWKWLNTFLERFKQ